MPQQGAPLEPEEGVGSQRADQEHREEKQGIEENDIPGGLADPGGGNRDHYETGDVPRAVFDAVESAVFGAQGAVDSGDVGAAALQDGLFIAVSVDISHRQAVRLVKAESVQVGDQNGVDLAETVDEAVQGSDGLLIGIAALEHLLHILLVRDIGCRVADHPVQLLPVPADVQGKGDTQPAEQDEGHHDHHCHIEPLFRRLRRSAAVLLLHRSRPERSGLLSKKILLLNTRKAGS